MTWTPDANAQCEYCGRFGPVKDEPFGQKPACQRCWEDICFGEDDR